MKTKNIFLLIFSMLFLACTPDPIPENTTTAETAKYKDYISIKQFLDTYMSEYGVYYPVRARSYTYNTSTRAYDVPNPLNENTYTQNNTGLFSIDTIAPVAKIGPVVIRGRIISDDDAGNLYKVMVIQDVDHPDQCLRISVDAGSIGGIYPMGQVINILTNGLGIGKYASEPQLCVPNYNGNIYAYNADQKNGWAPGRIPFPLFQQAVERIGMPEKDKVDASAQVMTIQQILDATSDDATTQSYQSRLICLKNVWFTNEYDNYGTPTACTNGDPAEDGNCGVFAPTTFNQGFPQGRYITDGVNKIQVSSSEYADFARILLPSSDYKFDIYGILGYYNDNSRNLGDKSKWQISIRSLNDLHQISPADKKWTPTEWTAQ